METVNYLTLAAARMADAAKFDATIKKAVFDAASDVGRDVVIRALCGSAIHRDSRQAA